MLKKMTRPFILLLLAFCFLRIFLGIDSNAGPPFSAFILMHEEFAARLWIVGFYALILLIGFSGVWVLCKCPMLLGFKGLQTPYDPTFPRSTLFNLISLGILIILFRSLCYLVEYLYTQDIRIFVESLLILSAGLTTYLGLSTAHKASNTFLLLLSLARYLVYMEPEVVPEGTQEDAPTTLPPSINKERT